MQVGVDDARLVAWDEEHAEWVHVGAPWEEDLLAFLATGPEAVDRARDLMMRPGRTTGRAPTGLPFAPGSLRAFALWERHMVEGAHGMIDRFGTPLQRRIVAAYEKITRTTFPALRMPANYHRFPQYYVGNHRSLVADGAVIPWPMHAEVVDFELEIGIVIGREVRNATREQARTAIAGFTLVNDLSLRDVQWSDIRNGTFGGVVKAKTWAGAMASAVTTADEILPRWDSLSGSVAVNGEVWARGSTAGSRWTPVDAVMYASRDESVYPGDLLSSGTLPGCCGLELRRFPGPGDRIELRVDGLGSITTTLQHKEETP